ncbi:unnamed protein product [Arabidopsis halleri]
MADEIWQDLQHMVLGRDDPELFVPQVVYASVVASNRLSLIGRPLNLQAQNLRRVISALPRTWGRGMVARVHGRILDGQGIPPPYVSELSVRFIAHTLGPVIEVDFNEITSTQIAFIRVKAAPNNEDNDDNDEEVLEVHVWEEEAGSNIPTPPPHLETQSSSSSSDISSYRPISQPPNPASSDLDLNQFVEEQQPIRFSTSSSSSRNGANAKARYEIGESSKRKKEKLIDLNFERNTRRCRQEHGIRFYPVEGQPP